MAKPPSNSSGGGGSSILGDDNASSQGSHSPSPRRHRRRDRVLGGKLRNVIGGGVSRSASSAQRSDDDGGGEDDTSSLSSMGSFAAASSKQDSFGTSPGRLQGGGGGRDTAVRKVGDREWARPSPKKLTRSGASSEATSLDDSESAGSISTNRSVASTQTALARQGKTKYNLGLVYVKNKDYDRANQSFLSAIESFTELHGSDHPDVAAAYEQLGNLARDRGDVVAAENHYEAALRALFGYEQDHVVHNSRSTRGFDAAAPTVKPPDWMNSGVTRALKSLSSGGSISSKSPNVSELRTRIQDNMKLLFPPNGDTSGGNVGETRRVETDSRNMDALLQSNVDTNAINLEHGQGRSVMRRSSILSELSMDTVGEEEEASSAVQGNAPNQSSSMAPGEHGSEDKDLKRSYRPGMDRQSRAQRGDELLVQQRRHADLVINDVAYKQTPGCEVDGGLESKDKNDRDRRTMASEKFQRGIHSYEQEDYECAKMWLLAYLQVDITFGGEDPRNDDDVALAEEKLGHCETQLGDHFAAQAHYHAALRTLRKKYGRLSEKAARVALSIGNSFVGFGMFDLALEMFESCTTRPDGELTDDAVDKVIQVRETLSNQACERKDYGNALLHRREILQEARAMISRGGADQIANYSLRVVEQLILISFLLIQEKDYNTAFKSLDETDQCFQDLPDAVQSSSKSRSVIQQVRYHACYLRAYAFEQVGKLNKAKKQYENAIALTKETSYSNGDKSFAGALLRLGGIYLRQGNEVLALEVLGEAMEIFKASETKANFNEQMWALDLAAAAHVRKGENRMAIGCLEERLCLTRRHFGEEHIVVANDQYRLGSLFAITGDHEEAVPHLSRSLTVKQREKGALHHETGSVHRSLAASCTALQQYDNALKNYRDLLTVMGQVTKDTPKILDAMGLIHLKAGRSHSALDSFGEALRILNSNRLLDDQLEARITLHLANASVLERDFSSAISCYDKVLWLQQGNGLRSEVFKRAMYNRGIALYRKCSFPEARSCFQEILDLLRTSSHDERYMAAVLNGKACIYASEGNHRDAIENYKKSLAVLQSSSLAEDIDAHLGVELDKSTHRKKSETGMDLCTGILMNLGTSLYKIGSHKKSMDVFQRAFQEQAIRRGKGDEKDRILQLSRLWAKMGHSSFHMKDYKAAMRHFEISLRDKRIALENSDHPDILKSRQAVALVVAKSSVTSANASKNTHLEKVLRIFEDVHDRLLATLGSDHIDVAKIQIDLAGVQCELGNLQQALDYLNSSRTILRKAGTPKSHPHFKQMRRWAKKVSKVAKKKRLVLEENGQNISHFSRETSGSL